MSKNYLVGHVNNFYYSRSRPTINEYKHIDNEEESYGLERGTSVISVGMKRGWESCVTLLLCHRTRGPSEVLSG